MKKVLALCSVLFLFSTSAAAFDGYIDVTNNTGYDIYYLYVSHAKKDTWGRDRLGDDILEDGETFRVNVRKQPTSIFDIHAEDEDGDTYTVWDLDIATDDLVLTLDHID
ncbi:hypothetical protein [Marinobacter zhejiangensis]|uniref:Uncharacterized protein n=1 Tax=Marinobacter zhejiangensis TaxID=488535 RepID=A0A1I4KXC9_9GAMM|nr:hypothetical protein [Marinobacter zhejiangensis]SFL83179.1 hypothetical protein SAMN04487963_0128 [Marinobacter zhejiangensis]